ncbi:hemerythrin domain-containing protein [Sulfurivermis fontis]|uniref:hemerythrin domain-containing protein n=1 Tax=Sulfurivermis fontis TaxID=1972068 RepID=UPI000FD92644|nr:hemerythrin domain-containing protein [Sulfurivermis fontis]
MFDFFKKKGESKQDAPAAATPQYNTAPGTEIRYHPELIDQLKSDHQALLGLYGEIKAAFDEGDYAAVSQKLDAFRSGLQSHLLTENVRLYIYLDRCLANDETNSELIRGFRREMDGIAKVAMNFLKKYEAIGVDKELAGAFAKDFATIGQVLGQRIQKEEQVLYPLYMPQY